MAKFTLPKVNKIASTHQKNIDRSERKPPEGGGIQSWEESVKEEIRDNTKSYSTQEMSSRQASKKDTAVDDASADEKTPLTPKIPAGEGGKKNQDTVELKNAEPVTKDVIDNKVYLKPQPIKDSPKTSSVESLPSTPTAIHQLAVPLNSKEYAMYNNIIERVNNVGLGKMIRGTDVQRASIHLLAKMKAETILQAHHKALMPMKPSEISNNKIHPISVPLQAKEFVMFNKIIDKVNALGLPKKVRGTDIQRASIYLLDKMNTEKILKAYYKVLMRE